MLIVIPTLCYPQRLVIYELSRSLIWITQGIIPHRLLLLLNFPKLSLRAVGRLSPSFRQRRGRSHC